MENATYSGTETVVLESSDAPHKVKKLTTHSTPIHSAIKSVYTPTSIEHLKDAMHWHPPTDSPTPAPTATPTATPTALPTATPTKAKMVLPVGMPSTDQARIINDAFEAAKVKDEGLAKAEDKQHLMDTAMQTAMPVVNKGFKKFIAHDLVSHTHHPRVHTILDKNMLEKEAMRVTTEAATEAVEEAITTDAAKRMSELPTGTEHESKSTATELRKVEKQAVEDQKKMSNAEAASDAEADDAEANSPPEEPLVKMKNDIAQVKHKLAAVKNLPPKDSTTQN